MYAQIFNYYYYCRPVLLILSFYCICSEVAFTNFIFELRLYLCKNEPTTEPITTNEEYSSKRETAAQATLNLCQTNNEIIGILMLHAIFQNIESTQKKFNVKCRLICNKNQQYFKYKKTTQQPKNPTEPKMVLNKREPIIIFFVSTKYETTLDVDGLPVRIKKSSLSSLKLYINFIFIML